jgi:hypothetical protein
MFLAYSPAALKMRKLSHAVVPLRRFAMTYPSTVPHSNKNILHELIRVTSFSWQGYCGYNVLLTGCVSLVRYCNYWILIPWSPGWITLSSPPPPKDLQMRYEKNHLQLPNAE